MEALRRLLDRKISRRAKGAKGKIRAHRRVGAIRTGVERKLLDRKVRKEQKEQKEKLESEQKEKLEKEQREVKERVEKERQKSLNSQGVYGRKRVVRAKRPTRL